MSRRPAHRQPSSAKSHQQTVAFGQKSKSLSYLLGHDRVDGDLNLGSDGQHNNSNDVKPLSVDTVAQRRIERYEQLLQQGRFYQRIGHVMTQLKWGFEDVLRMNPKRVSLVEQQQALWRAQRRWQQHHEFLALQSYRQYSDLFHLAKEVDQQFLPRLLEHLVDDLFWWGVSSPPLYPGTRQALKEKWRVSEFAARSCHSWMPSLNKRKQPQQQAALPQQAKTRLLVFTQIRQILRESLSPVFREVGLSQNPLPVKTTFPRDLLHELYQRFSQETVVGGVSIAVAVRALSHLEYQLLVSQWMPPDHLNTLQEQLLPATMTILHQCLEDLNRYAEVTFFGEELLLLYEKVYGSDLSQLTRPALLIKTDDNFVVWGRHGKGQWGESQSFDSEKLNGLKQIQTALEHYQKAVFLEADSNEMEFIMNQAGHIPSELQLIVQQLSHLIAKIPIKDPQSPHHCAALSQRQLLDIYWSPMVNDTSSILGAQSAHKYASTGYLRKCLGTGAILILLLSSLLTGGAHVAMILVGKHAVTTISAALAAAGVVTEAAHGTKAGVHLTEAYQKRHRHHQTQQWLERLRPFLARTIDGMKWFNCWVIYMAAHYQDLLASLTRPSQCLFAEGSFYFLSLLLVLQSEALSLAQKNSEEALIQTLLSLLACWDWSTTLTQKKINHKAVNPLLETRWGQFVTLLDAIQTPKIRLLDRYRCPVVLTLVRRRYHHSYFCSPGKSCHLDGSCPSE